MTLTTLDAYKTLKPEVSKKLQEYPLVVVTAHRGSGITTALQCCFGDYEYFDCTSDLDHVAVSSSSVNIILDRIPLTKLDSRDWQRALKEHRVVIVTSPWSYEYYSKHAQAQGNIVREFLRMHSSHVRYRLDKDDEKSLGDHIMGNINNDYKQAIMRAAMWGRTGCSVAALVDYHAKHRDFKPDTALRMLRYLNSITSGSVAWAGLAGSNAAWLSSCQDLLAAFWASVGLATQTVITPLALVLAVGAAVLGHRKKSQGIPTMLDILLQQRAFSMLHPSVLSRMIESVEEARREPPGAFASLIEGPLEVLRQQLGDPQRLQRWDQSLSTVSENLLSDRAVSKDVERYFGEQQITPEQFVTELEDHLIEAMNSIAEQVRKSVHFKRFVSTSASVLDSTGEVRADPKGELSTRLVHSDLINYIATQVRPGKTILLLGGPGSGKTILWWMLSEAASHFEEPLLPVPINVQTLRLAETRSGLIRQALANVDFSDEELRALDEKQRLLLLIDGLNEIEYSTTVREATKQVVRVMISGHERCPVVATSRAPVPPSFQVSAPTARPVIRLLLLPFDEDQRRTAVAKRPEVDAEQFEDYLGTGHLYTLASNPQLLAILMEIFLSGRESPAPRSVAEIFQLFFEKKWAEKAPLVDQPEIGREAFRRSLATLAWHIRLHGLASASKEEWARLLSPFESLLKHDGLSRQNVLDRAHALYVMELHRHDLVFVHERFTDHFAAHFLKHLGDIPECVWREREWEQTLVHLAGLSDDAGLRQILDGCIQRKLIALACQVAAGNLGRFSTDSLEKVFALTARGLYGPRPSRDDAARGLGEFAVPDAVNGLRLVLSEFPPRNRPSIRHAIDLLRLSRLTPETLQSELRWSRRRAESKFGRLKKRASVSSSWVPSKRGDYSSNVMHDLQTLVTASAPPKERASTAKRLGLSGDRAAVPALSALLDKDKEPGPAVRGTAANALGMIGDRTAVPALSALLDKDKEPDAYVRGSAANALGMIGSTEALGALTAVMSKDPDPKVRGAALSSCLTMLDPGLFKPFKDRFEEDDDPINRTNAIRGLVLLRDSRAAEVCMKGLYDPDPGVRGQCARGLAQLARLMNTEKQAEIAERLVRFYINLRHTAVANAVRYAIMDLPPEIADRTLSASKVKHTKYEEWWNSMREEVRLAVRCQAESACLKQDEQANFARFWSLPQIY